GWYVADLEPGSPAATAGLRKHQRVTAVGGRAGDAATEPAEVRRWFAGSPAVTAGGGALVLPEAAATGVGCGRPGWTARPNREPVCVTGGAAQGAIRCSKDGSDCSGGCVDLW